MSVLPSGRPAAAFIAPASLAGPMLFGRSDDGADYETLHAIQDEASGLRVILAVHSTARGPAFGGIRRLAYPSEADALDDALRLAQGMSLKCALAGLPAGGAKTVILDHPDLDRAAAYARLGRFIEELGGRYVCGPDVGTGEAEMDAVRAETRWANPKGNDAGAATAAGVLAGLRGVLSVLHGDPGAAGRTFVVQGLGSVGAALAQALGEAGGTVLAADVADDDAERARAVGAEPLDPAEALSTPCDVFVPCALGGVLTPETAGHLAAKAVCGSANNQLSDPTAGRILHERGILYAPDFAVNAGAVAEGVFTVRDGATDAVREEARRHIEKAEATVAQILEKSLGDDVPSVQVASAMAHDRLRRA